MYIFISQGVSHAFRPITASQNFTYFFYMVDFIFQRSAFDFTGCFLQSRDISHIVSPGFFSLKNYVRFHTFFDTG